MPGSEDVKRGVDVATVFISYRMRSEFEVRRRLKRAHLSNEDAGIVIARMKEMKLIDDEAFAGAYARDQIIGKNRGPMRVTSGLLALGIDKEMSGAAIEEVVAEHDTFELAMTLGEKRWAKLDAVENLASRKKRVFEYLVRRGYTFGDSRRVIDELERTGGRS